MVTRAGLRVGLTAGLMAGLTVGVGCVTGDGGGACDETACGPGVMATLGPGPVGTTGEGSTSSTLPPDAGTTARPDPSSGPGPMSDDESGPPSLFDVGGSPDVRFDPPELEAVVYAHDSTRLYRLDPDTLALDQIGPFVGCNGLVADIAVNQDNEVFASAGSIYAVDVETAECTLVSASNFGNNLSFVPPGVLHPDREIMVTYSVREYRSLDVETGIVSEHGMLPWPVAGDIVSINNGPTFVSVVYPEGANHLVRVDPATGELIADEGPIGSETQVWGLGFWGGTIYGFSATGNINTVEVNDDGTTTTTLVEATDVDFWGAGSSTFAPVTPAG